MSRQTRLIAAVLGGAAVLALVVAWLMIGGGHGDKTSWSSSQRKSFMTSCVKECRATPGVTPDRYPICDVACTCAADEGEKIMTADELDTADQAVHAGTASPGQKEKMNRLAEAGRRCVTGAATPAKK